MYRHRQKTHSNRFWCCSTFNKRYTKVVQKQILNALQLKGNPFFHTCIVDVDGRV